MEIITIAPAHDVEELKSHLSTHTADCPHPCNGYYIDISQNTQVVYGVHVDGDTLKVQHTYGGGEESIAWADLTIDVM
jgi:hypothetical protein